MPSALHRLTTCAPWLIAALTAGPTAAPAAAAVAGSSDDADTLVVIPSPRDGVAPEQRAEVEAAIAAFHARMAGRGPAKAAAAPPFPFFPHAGVLGRDIFLNNFTDQDDRPELVRDWDCSDYTYDGHHGHDSLIRSFREQAIGVPVFAALPGEVLEVHDGEPDRNTELMPGARANYVLLGHGDGYTTWYLHFRRDSVGVAVGQQVAAGTQLGLTGSSGFSNWPHLHFETSKDRQWLEPSAGPCRSGDSLWVEQPPVFRDFYVADLYLSRRRIILPDRETFLADEAQRAGSFVTGRQTIGLRADLRNLPEAAAYRLSIRNPRGKVVYDRSGGYGNQVVERLSLAVFALELDLDMVGAWRLRAEIGGLVVEAPFRVVANSRQLGNRKPNRITARLGPAHAVPGEVLTCTVQTSLVTEDPDYDLVSYRYEWRVNNRVVRAVTSAATTDLLAADVALPQDKVSCRVTPSDVKSLGATALAIAAEF